MNPNPEQNPEDGILASQIKVAGRAYSLSEDKAKAILSQFKAPALSPLSSQFKRRDQGRSVISNFMGPINVFMSTTAKTGLVALVLVLVGVFSYTQLGTRPSGDVAMNKSVSPEMAGDAATSMMMTAEAPAIIATGNVDDAVSAILSSSASESLVLGEEDADAALIANDSQELLDLSQSITDNDF